MRKSSTVNSLASTNIEDSSTSELSQDIDAMLASFSAGTSAGTLEKNEGRKAPRYRVKWHADILIGNHSKHHGFINDISTVGASIYLNHGLPQIKSTLHIHVPPLSATSKPYVIKVSGMIVYVVYDGEKQLYRAAINFLKFNVESERALLDERLTKHQTKISESSLVRC